MESHLDRRSWHATLDTSGRLLLPSELRDAVNAKPGTAFVWTLNDGQLQVRTLGQAVEFAQEYFLSLDDPSHVWSDELIAERRIEAEHE